MPAQRVPIEQKLRRGSASKAERAEVVVVDIDERRATPPPKPDRPLGKTGQKLWEQVWATATWLTPADEPTVLTLCELEDERVVYRTKALADPEKNWRQTVAARQIERNQIAITATLGLSPASRAMLGLAMARTTATAATTDNLMSRRSSGGRKQIHPGPEAGAFGSG